jgi:hypothetical protein
MLTFESLFPREQWEHSNVRAETPAINGDVPMFRMKGSELRVIAMPGVAPGTRTVIGYHILFRAGDNSMNMHVECSCDEGMLRATIKTAVAMSGAAAISHSKFIENFVRWYAEKCAGGRTRRLFDACDAETNSTYTGAEVAASPPSLNETPSATVDSTSLYPSQHVTYSLEQQEDLVTEPRDARTATAGSSESAAQLLPAASTETHALAGQAGDKAPSKRARFAEDETVECSVCMSVPADTLAVPCGHSVVCAACSRTLAAQAGSANRTHCVVCRAIITHVAYPDNSVVAIN